MVAAKQVVGGVVVRGLALVRQRHSRHGGVAGGAQGSQAHLEQAARVARVRRDAARREERVRVRARQRIKIAGEHLRGVMVASASAAKVVARDGAD